MLTRIFSDLKMRADVEQDKVLHALSASRWTEQLRVCHVASGDVWAGAEVQLVTLLQELRHFQDLLLSVILLNRGRLFDEVSALGMPVNVLNEGGLTSLQILRCMHMYFKKWKPDIVHTHRYKENILGGIAAKLAGVPSVVHTMHGVEEELGGWKWAKMRVYCLLNRLVARWTANRIIGVSRQIAELARVRIRNTHVTCVHNGINVLAVRPSSRPEDKRRELDIPEKAVVIGTVGRLSPVKGIEYLLKAMNLLYKEEDIGLVKVLIVGDGSLRRELEAIASRLEIADQTLFLGLRDDIYDLVNMFDICVFPSLHEGVPMALLEAMNLGCPVVASRVGGIPEVVEDNVEGKLVPARDINALRDAIKELALSRELREKFGAAGRERIRRYYDAKLMASRVRELYWGGPRVN